MKVAIAPPPIPVGKIKSFGAIRAKIRGRPSAPPLDVGDWMIEITMLETGEKAEYRLTHLSDYLEAH